MFGCDWMEQFIECDHCGTRILGEPEYVAVDGKMMKLHKRCKAEVVKKADTSK